jgi:polyhydroxybutyrate depolymerase
MNIFANREPHERHHQGLMDRWCLALQLLTLFSLVESQQLVGLTLMGFPHTFDVFAPSAPSQGLVFLHGGGGTKEGLEASLNVTLDWAETHGVLLAFPQGQSLQTCVSPPCKAYTWSNYVMDSGQDDVAFLDALALYLYNTTAAAFPALPLGARLSLAGHSNGAMMANRVWCETGDATFDNFFSFEGPPSSYVPTPKLAFTGLLPKWCAFIHP